MDERIMQFRVGVFFLATLLIAGILLVMFGKLPDLTSGYNVSIRFQEASGVSKDTPVRKSGILIGRVTDVQLIDGDAGVLVTAKISEKKQLYQNEDCRIMRNFLSGDTALVFFPVAGRPGAGIPLAPNTTLKGVDLGDPTDLMKELKSPVERFTKTAESLGYAAEKLGHAAERVETILDDRTVKNIKSACEDASQSLASIREILGKKESRENLAKAMEELPETVEKINKTFDMANESLQKFSKADGPDKRSPIDRLIHTAEMAEKTMRTFSEPGAQGELAPSEQMANAMKNINEITNVLDATMKRLENGDGTLGAFMKDRQLYDRLNRTVKNLEEISWKLQPIVDDARVITDKIARHPGVIVRDAVKPGVGIK